MGLETLAALAKNALENVPWQLWAFVLTFAFLLFSIWWGKQKHTLCKLEAGQQLKALKRLPSPQEQMLHLRHVPPFVFEEMILTALELRGLEIIRNRRYTGDGGIDGRVYIHGRLWLIQAKRYKSHIKAKHVRSFARACERRNTKGLFVHTGKTGKESRTIARFEKIEIISGQRLLNMLIESKAQEQATEH